MCIVRPKWQQFHLGLAQQSGLLPANFEVSIRGNIILAKELVKFQFRKIADIASSAE